jgi:UDP-GlcNAc:undecaprenyl-phosphate GlcNAc-1-phosphate transferase
MALLPFVVSFSLSVLSVPIVREFCFRTGKVKKPRKDRWHQSPTPTLGGIAMFIGFAGAVLILGLYNRSITNWPWHILVASIVMFGMGVFDDIKPIAPPTKFIIQLIAAGIVIYFGNLIRFFPWPIANIVLTFVWLVGITNAINLLDNMDGLASGVSMIAAGILTYFFWQEGNQALLILSLSLAGAILGFLVFNFPPAKIFMGDSGSMLLGFTLAALAVARQRQASNVFAIMGVPILLFFLPILDTTLVTITRLMRGQSPAQGGTDHTSHRLIAFGLTERQAVLFLYGVAFLSGISSTLIEALNYNLSLVLIPILLISLAVFTAYLGRLKVVTAIAPTRGSLGWFVQELTYKRRLFEIALDLGIIGSCYYLAFWAQSGLDMTQEGMRLFLRSWPVALVTAYFSFYIFGVYRGVWRYVGIDDLLRYARGVIGGCLLTGIVLWVLYPNQYSPVILLLYAVFLYLILSASRLSFQALDRAYIRQRKAETAGVLLYGAEDAGEMALRWILQNPSMGYRPVGFLDDDSLKWGRSIHGVDVLGGSEQLETILKDHDVRGVIISSPADLQDEFLANLVTACREKGVWVKVMRLAFESIE